MKQATQAIIFTDIEKRFGAQPVLRRISGAIGWGEVIAIIGATGCGKSTLLRCWNGLETIDSGQLVVNGVDLTPPSLKAADLRQLRSQVGMVFQQFNLFPHLTVLENLTLPPRQVLRQSAQESTNIAKFFLQKVGLLDKANAYPEQLSGGQKQRVAIARSLCMHPRILLFDEPTSALHPEMVREVLEVIQTLAEEGVTIVIATYELQFVREVGTRIFFLDQGQIAESGPAWDLLTQPQTDRLQAFLNRMNLVLL
ncbi:MAG: amino acid ABC transporter ATP-binding protein [Aphanocapsa sp. GSE-SYN-MK-11-07L]|jgi:arginine/lysine/histidine/glutamine transport system ATP-binding protein|nr:amino acid ABC transporter ATP-binding protein [Aphanocapsa sp. GSE-SYN-MK-11-07L]